MFSRHSKITHVLLQSHWNFFWKYWKTGPKTVYTIIVWKCSKVVWIFCENSLKNHHIFLKKILGYCFTPGLRLLQKDSETTLTLLRNILLQFHWHKKIPVRLDGPYAGSTTRAWSYPHCIFVAGGIGVTPFASLLQSIVRRFKSSMTKCSKCSHLNCSQLPASIGKLKHVVTLFLNASKMFRFNITQFDRSDMTGGFLLGQSRFTQFQMVPRTALRTRGGEEGSWRDHGEISRHPTPSDGQKRDSAFRQMQFDTMCPFFQSCCIMRLQTSKHRTST